MQPTQRTYINILTGEVYLMHTDTAGAAIGGRFKTHIKRLIDKGLIHKDTYKFTGTAVPIGNLSHTISEFLTFNEVTV